MKRDTTFRAAFMGACRHAICSDRPIFGVAQAQLLTRIVAKLDAGAGITARPLRSAL